MALFIFKHSRLIISYDTKLENFNDRAVENLNIKFEARFPRLHQPHPGFERFLLAKPRTDSLERMSLMGRDAGVCSLATCEFSQFFMHITF